MPTQFVMIPKKESEFLRENKEHILSSKDWEILIDYWHIFEKFLKKTSFSYQISLSEWKHRWKEEAVWNKIEWISEIINSLTSIETTMEEFNLKKAEEEENKRKLEKDW